MPAPDLTPLATSFLHALANAILAIHIAFVGFVVIGLLLIVAGGVRGWSWVRNPWFRWSHLAAIGIVVVQAWLGIICPLTTLEMHLRDRAGNASYDGSFIAHWMQELLYINAPWWAFTVAYTLFAIIVLASWILIRPRRFRRPKAFPNGGGSGCGR
jgi:hypothetical protein